MKKWLILASAWAALAGAARAVETKFWVQDSRQDYEKAVIKRLSVRGDGRITLAPAFEELYDSSTQYLWAVAQDSKGVLYAGGGSPNSSTAALIAVGPDGKSRVAAELPGMQIQAIAIARGDRVYAATSPDGKVYRIGPDGKHDVLYDPKSKYIWAMVFNPAGDLFIATGDQGEVHRVRPSGEGGVFFRTEETHARSLALDAHGNLIVGTEPGGLVLRVSAAGEGFVLYQSPKREVTAVAAAKDGSIYAAAAGVKQPGALPPAAPPAPAPAPAPQPSAAAVGGQRAQPVPAPAPTLAPPPLPAAGGSEVYRIDAEGYARKVWSDPREVAYAIGFDPEGRALIGTGNEGNVHRIDSDTVSTLLLKAAPSQVTAFASGKRGELYAVTGNVGKLYRIGPGLEKEGYLESDILDAGSFSYWGRLSFKGDARGGSLAIETRSGNLDRPRKNWSPWSKLAPGVDGGRIQSPPARFLQWKATLSAAPDGQSPSLGGIEAAYLAKNVAPVIREIESTPANYRFPAPSLSLTPSQTLSLPPLGGSSRRGQSPSLSVTGGPQTLNYAKGYIGARWLASDENGDTLTYKVEIRGTGETQWRLIEEKVSTQHLSWDSTAYPDGEYRLRVTASDAPSNAAGEALTAQIESEPFLIDNTPPVIAGLSGRRSGGKLVVEWKAADALNIIEKAEYSLNGGPWLPVPPLSKLSDWRELEYSLTLDGAPGEQVVAVRVADWYGNQRVGQTVIK